MSSIKKFSLVADENMPLLDELFACFAQIQKLPGREIKATHLVAADALLCRSVTQVNATLLNESPVKFVGSATIGIDHLDTQWLDNNKITWTNAAGCNAAAVAQYVISAISHWCLHKHKKITELKVAIVGAGNVGSLLAAYLNILCVDYVLCDPPLKKCGDKRRFVSFEEALNCDVVSLHVPLTHNGDCPTYHLLNANNLNRLKHNQLVINSARGGVIDNLALRSYLNQPQHADFALDVFENEPHIDGELVKRCWLATPHIAGHTLEGKLRGSFFIYQAFCQHFGISPTVLEETIYPPVQSLNVDLGLSVESVLLKIYDIAKDSEALSKQVEISEDFGQSFDKLRKHYLRSHNQTRRDYSGWFVAEADKKTKHLNDLIKTLKRLTAIP
ncbi:4-phosphoerythronate dehydrogenase [Aliikangiella sp. IMCC44653]